MRSDYQYGFSDAHPEAMYDHGGREQKARKMVAILQEYYGQETANLCVLDVACSTGIISYALSKQFRSVTGIDIDEAAIAHAKQNFQADNLRFSLGDAMAIDFPDNSFDIVICAHVYEHVPDATRMFCEIYRVLKPTGICYFAAGNRLILMEQHYKLPLLSVIPKPLANLYLCVTGKGRSYYEKHLTLWGLRKLVSRFEVVDYTLKVIDNPTQYSATEMLQAGTRKQRLAAWLVRRAYWLCPTYIWLLRKPAR